MLDSAPVAGPPLTTTIVICTRNRPSSLRRCLAAIARLRAPRFELIVVDNASDTAETREVAESFGARSVVEPIPGVNRARNRGIRASTSDVVVFIDDDAIPTADWLANIVREFDADPRVMAVGGRIIVGYEHAPDTSAGAQLSGYDCGPDRQVVDRDAVAWFERTNFGGMGNGANMAFRRSAVERWGGFDERIGYGTGIRGYGDHNAFFRVVHSGFRAVYTPDAVVFHPLDATLDEIVAKRLRSIHAWGAYLTLLAVEYPEHRGRILRYAGGALFGVRRKWRPPSGPSVARIARWRTMAAVARGPFAYLRARSRR